MRSRALQVRVVRADAAPGESVEIAPITPEQVNEIITTQVQNIAVTVGMVLLTKKAADTLSELILIAGKKYI